MTKHLWLAGFALLSVGLEAQVGINAGQKTDAPQYQEIAKDAVLQVANKQGEHKGVLLPSVSLNSTTDQSSITKDGQATVTKGLLVWCDGQGTGADKLAEGYYYWDGAQWVKIGGATAVSAPANTLYTSNGTLTGDRTVDQNDHNLTISTGIGNLKIEGKTIIASAVSVDPNVAGVPSYQLHSNGLATAASKGRNIRVYNGTSAPDYADSDYMIVLTNDGVDGSLHLPSASKYPGRIIYLLNGTTQGLGFSSTGTEDVYPFNFGTIAVSAGVGFVSTGKTWYVIGR